MPRKTVFISSTYKDLHEYRKALWELLPAFDVDVRGMEQFGARSTCPRETCLAEVEQSDVYVGIIAFRLGSVDAETKRSFTELEYEHAVKAQKDIRIYLAEEDTPFPASVIDKGDYDVGRLNAFKEHLRRQHTIAYFSSKEDLVQKLRTDFEQSLPSKEPPASTDLEEQFDRSARAITEFRLTPARYNGTEVRLQIKFRNGPYPASRDVCRRFNLDYGATIVFGVNITRPKGKGLVDGLYELFATGNLMDRLRKMAATENADLYASLRFAEEDVKKTSAEFFGKSYNPWEEPDYDDGSVYIPPEGKVIMLFTKPA